MRRVIVRATARDASWDGVLRGWIEQRGRALREHPGVCAVHIAESPLPGYRWELQLELRADARSETALRELLTDLELLGAKPVVADSRA